MTETSWQSVTGKCTIGSYSSRLQQKVFQVCADKGQCNASCPQVSVLQDCGLSWPTASSLCFVTPGTSCFHLSLIWYPLSRLLQMSPDPSLGLNGVFTVRCSLDMAFPCPAILLSQQIVSLFRGGSSPWCSASCAFSSWPPLSQWPFLLQTVSNWRVFFLSFPWKCSLFYRLQWADVSLGTIYHTKRIFSLFFLLSLMIYS